MKVTRIIIIAVTTFIWGATSSTLTKEYIAGEWRNYKSTYNKAYVTEAEEIHRQKIFEDNLYSIEEHNEKYAQGLVTFAVGINEFSDLTDEEFEEIYLGGYIADDLLFHEGGIPYVPQGEVKAVEGSVDWRAQGMMTPVRDQGSCGSCWAFACTGALEARLKINNNPEVILSPQQLVDCDKSGSDGCKGGNIRYPYNYMKNGIDTEASYPYEARDGECRFNTQTIGARTTGYVYMEHSVERKEDVMAAWVKEGGPVATLVNLSPAYVHNVKAYNGTGVLQCDEPVEVNHAIVIAGYGNENGLDYWLFKNSWTTDWGDKGYGKLLRSGSNNCNVGVEATYPLL